MTSRDDRDRRRSRRRRPLGWAAALVVAVLGSSCAVEFHLGDKYDSQVGATATEAAADGTLTPAVAVSGTPLIVEDFDGTTLDADVWNTCHWWDDGGCTIATNDELEWYLPGQVRVRDGTLALTAEKRTTVGASSTVTARSRASSRRCTRFWISRRCGCSETSTTAPTSLSMT